MPPTMPTPIDDLATLRDWLRYAVSSFTKAKLVYGHGTANAVDEAAFLILSMLNLPIGNLEPWLDCRLTRDEREQLLQVISARVTTRKPAPYLIQSAWIQGHKFYVDERVIVPRSYIGELLCSDQLATAVTDPDSVTSVLELCTGSGCLAILAALAFPSALVTAIDISNDALEVARRNVSDYELGDRVSLLKSDLFAAIGKQRFDLIIANPPYVTLAAVAAFPPEYQAEPELAHLGGHDGLDLVKRIIDEAPRYLQPNGVLVVEIGDAREALEAAYPLLPFLWLDTEVSEGEVFMLTAEDLSSATKQSQPRKPARPARRTKP
jgi:ribosomal protein L3 glutamine methyltransferase